jgi:hypothetical protein
MIRNDLRSSSRGRVHLALATENIGNVDEATAVRKQKEKGIESVMLVPHSIATFFQRFSYV